MVLVALSLKAQTIVIPDTWTNASTGNLDKLTEWVVKGEITGIPGTKKFYISDSWSPSNADLNAIKVAGGDTEDWPLFWIVNDTNFFYQPVSPLMGSDIVSLKSATFAPYKTWGDYLAQNHEIYYRSATTPDQYWVLASNRERILKLSEVIDIKSAYNSYMPGYVTLPTVLDNVDKVQRKQDGTF